MAANDILQRVIRAENDPRPMAALRIVVGLNAVLCGLEVWNNLEPIVRPDSLRVPFSWGPLPLTEGALRFFMAAWFAAAGLVTLGWHTLQAGMVLAALMGYALLLDQQAYSNHLYLLTLEVFFLVLGDAGACWSIDAWRRGAKDRVPAWPSTLWKWQISIVYFFAATAKLNPTFLSGQMLANSWPTEGPLGFLAAWRTPQVLEPMAWLSVALEFYLAFALWLPALRWSAVVFGVFLHLGMVLLVSQKDPTGIVVFALATVPPYVLFFDFAKPAHGAPAAAAPRGPA